MKFYDPLNHAVFAKLFWSNEHKNITISFLNAILEFENDNPIINIEREPLNVYDYGYLLDGKRRFFDIYCDRQNGEHLIVQLEKMITPPNGNRLTFFNVANTYA